MRLIHYTHPVVRDLVAPFARSAFAGCAATLDDVFADAANGAATVRPDAHWAEDDRATTVRLDLPGVDRASLELEVKDNLLTVQAKRRVRSATADEAAREITYRRDLALAPGVGAEQISANYADGVLTVTLPKPAAAQPRRIAVS
jgi:HSP20 family protein